MIRDLSITTLAENSAQLRTLGQWGLSFFLEFIDARGRKRKVVFDTGINKQALMHNIKQLKVDLDKVDCIVLSHGHLDHTATTVEVVKRANGAKVYAHPHTFQSRFFEKKTGKRQKIGVPKGEGIDEIEKAGGKVLLTTEPAQVVPGVWTTGQIKRKTTFEQVFPFSKGERFVIVVDSEEMDDQILDDQALWMDVDGTGPFVITGCAHAGLVNTLLHIQTIGQFKQIYGLVGGTHLVGRSEVYVDQTIKKMEQFGLEMISPCHCTGFKATTRLWQAFPEEFVLNFCGRIIEPGNEPERRII